MEIELIYECKNCGHEWITRLSKKKPKSCPKCKRYDWESGKNELPK